MSARGNGPKAPFAAYFQQDSELLTIAIARRSDQTHRMILSPFFKAVLPVTLASLAFACGDGGGGNSGGDGDGDGDGSGGMMGDGDGDTGGSSSGGSGTGGGDGDGDGPFIDGSGTVSMTFNGTQVELDVWYASQDPEDLDFYFVGDAPEGGTVDIIQISFRPAESGTFDCMNLRVADIVIQADDSEGSTASFESGYATSCTLTVTEYGPVEEPVRGTFAAELGDGSGEIVSVQGSFDLVRGSDS